MSNGKKATKRFLIKQGDTYYLTAGRLLEYNKEEAKGNERKERDVERVANEFKRIGDGPHTYYQAVDVSDSDMFGPINTNQLF
jgi:hypothetical protein